LCRKPPGPWAKPTVKMRTNPTKINSTATVMRLVETPASLLVAGILKVPEIIVLVVIELSLL